MDAASVDRRGGGWFALGFPAARLCAGVRHPNLVFRTRGRLVRADLERRGVRHPRGGGHRGPPGGAADLDPSARDTAQRIPLAADAVALQREDVGDFGDATTLIRYLEDRFDVAANALSRPNFIYAAVLREDGASIYVAFDHSNVDACHSASVRSEP